MKRLARALFISLALIGLVYTASAGKTHVGGYYRKNVTYVHSYDRNSPGSGASGSGSDSKSPGTTSPSTHVHTSNYSVPNRSYGYSGYVGARDSRGRIVRSESAKREFMRMSGYPHGRPGYVVDHIVALKRGGPDTPSNMQWQTISEAKAKDKWE